MNEAVNMRLNLRFTTALAALSEHLTQAPADWPFQLHPACLAFIRSLKPGVECGKVEDFEQAALDLWARAGGHSDEPRARCDDLICHLELSLAQYPDCFAQYFEAARAWMSPVERADLFRVVTSRRMTISLRQRIRDIAFSRRIPAPEADDIDQVRNQILHAPALALTAPQKYVSENLLRMGELFFDQSRPRFPFEPRLAPLIAGKTGAGKGHVMSYVARELRCELVHITFGGWIVAGASSDYYPTLWLILEKLAANDRVLVLLDELDKFDANFASGELSGWSRSVANELWALLDRRMPVQEFLRSSRSDMLDTLDNREMLAEKVRERLWIVGVGTWQHLHRTPTRPMGFHRVDSSNCQVDGGVDERIWANAGISEELMGRFNPRIIELHYPSSKELERLLEETGIIAFARERGMRIDVEKLDLSRGGMRVVEDLITRLLLGA